MSCCIFLGRRVGWVGRVGVRGVSENGCRGRRASNESVLFPANVPPISHRLAPLCCFPCSCRVHLFLFQQFFRVRARARVSLVTRDATELPSAPAEFKTPRWGEEEGEGRHSPTPPHSPRPTLLRVPSHFFFLFSPGSSRRFLAIEFECGAF